MRNVKVISALLLITLLSIGCSGGKPEGIPKLFPTKITVVKGSAPVANANVFLVPSSGTATGSWSVSGKTDATGLAIIQTSQGDWVGAGAPEGEYKIYLTKFAEIEEPERPADMDSNEEAKKAYYDERQKRLEAAGSEIPAAMNSAETSGLSISISGSNTELQIDVDQTP